MAGSALVARGLTRDFRGFRAVDGVDLDVAAGAVHALVGPNGAGKTTLFNLLTGFLAPSAGRIELAGAWPESAVAKRRRVGPGVADITGLAPERIARLGLARSFQIASLFPQQSVLAHVELALQGGTSLGWAFWRSERPLRRFRAPAEELLERVGLAAAAQEPAGSLPYGRKRALELAIALALDPTVLLLDEPTAGMGAEDVERTIELIAAVRDGRTVVLVEHNMSVVGRLADRVTVLQAGRVLAEGPYERVRADERVVEAYLGSADAAH